MFLLLGYVLLYGELLTSDSAELINAVIKGSILAAVHGIDENIDSAKAKLKKILTKWNLLITELSYVD